MPSVSDTPQARSGILARLRQMYRGKEPMSDIQKDLVALESFCGFHHEGLQNYFFASGQYFPLLRDAMARHGFARTASVLDKVSLLFPIGLEDTTRDELIQQQSLVLRTYEDRIRQFEAEIERYNEDYEAAIDLIFRDRWSELPEPLELLPGRWGINPFNGEKTYFKPRYPR